MIITLTHPFIFRCSDRNSLLNNCLKLNTFLHNLDKQSKSSPDENKYKGDGLELFAEALIKLSPIDKRVGITDYNVVTDNDTGVDGFGIGINGRPATVQVKNRTANYILTANEDHLTNFSNTSFIKYGVKVEDKDNMLIITTADDLHHYTDNEMFDGKVRCLNRENLRRLVDDNNFFWNSFIVSWDLVINSNRNCL